MVEKSSYSFSNNNNDQSIEQNFDEIEIIDNHEVDSNGVSSNTVIINVKTDNRNGRKHDLFHKNDNNFENSETYAKMVDEISENTKSLSPQPSSSDTAKISSNSQVINKGQQQQTQQSTVDLENVRQQEILQNDNSDSEETPFNGDPYSAFKRGNVVRGILCPSLTNSFRAQSLERSYLTYSHRQRQKSLIIVNIVDVGLKIALAIIWIFNRDMDAVMSLESVTWSVACIVANLGICILGLWRCFANNYLHWAATCTWLLLNLQGFVGEGLGFAEREDFLWYVLFIIFVPYSMLPLPLKWCMIGGSISAFCHLVIMIIIKFQKKSQTCVARQLIANSLLYLAINFAGMYTKYLTDRSQRLAFIETHKAMEHKKESEKEYQKTQKLLDSILPMFVNKDIRKEMYNTPDNTVDAQFKKLFIYYMENVSILFADIKGFTELASKTSAQQLVEILNDLFARFDKIAEDNFCLRIKLLGDCYYCISMFDSQTWKSRPDHAVCSVETGLHMIKAIKDTKHKVHVDLNMRIGIHSGSVMCGVLGNKKWHFDVWSNDVIIANHMESGGIPGRVHISEATKQCLNDTYELEDGDGGDRDNHLKMMNIKTYLIKRNDPLRPSKRFCYQPKPSEDFISTPAADPPTLSRYCSKSEDQEVSKASSDGGGNSGGDGSGGDGGGSGAGDDESKNEETTTEWIPEIPFKNLNELEVNRRREYSFKYPARSESIEMSATEEVDEFIDQNIQINSNRQMRNEFLYSWTLKFKDGQQEQRYFQLREDMFRSNMLCVYVIWIFIVLCQAVIVPGCTILVICLAATTLLLTAGCFLVMAEEFSGLPIGLQKKSAALVDHRNRRTAFICVTIILMSISSSIALFICPMVGSTHEIDLTDGIIQITKSKNYDDNEFTQNQLDTNCLKLQSQRIHEKIRMLQNQNIPVHKISNPKIWLTLLENPNDPNDSMRQIFAHLKEIGTINKNQHKETDNLLPSIKTTINPKFTEGDPCSYPEYLVFTWVLCLIAVATGLKLYYLVKTFIAIVMVVCYGALILAGFPDVFSNAAEITDDFQKGMPLAAQMVILLVVFSIMVTYHARLVEVTSRLDFIWKEQAEKELANMKSNRYLNDVLIKNILPDHVASYYLSDGRSDELYAKMHNMCAVMFASIPNFQDFYSEDIENGKACIRILNEIICDFDSVLEEERFSTVEKIKTVGFTYMAAAGLKPKNENQDGNINNIEEDCVCQLVEFAITLRQKLQEVNKDAFNSFQLRVGISTGPLVSGVIGARKPVYDIWGNTVNVASRMDSTGVNWKIQVPDYTAELLTRKGYTCVARGGIEVKGKGLMQTCWVLGKGITQSTSSTTTTNNILDQILQSNLSNIQTTSTESIATISQPPMSPTGPIKSTTSATVAFQRQTSYHSSLAAVVLGMIQASKRTSNQTTTSTSNTPMPESKFIRRTSEYNSAREYERNPTNLTNPVRRNTTRSKSRTFKRDKISRI